jgi:hypothetical protein
MNPLETIGLAVAVLAIASGIHFIRAMMNHERKLDDRSRRQWLREEYPDIFGNTPER